MSGPILSINGIDGIGSGIANSGDMGTDLSEGRLECIGGPGREWAMSLVEFVQVSQHVDIVRHCFPSEEFLPHT